MSPDTDDVRQDPDRTTDRRSFLLRSGAAAVAVGCGLVAPRSAGATPVPHRRIRRGPNGAEPWGRLEPVASGVWALVSTPLNDHPEARRTLCNGGIIAGSDGVLMVEGFGSPEGAEWLAGRAVALTGRLPTHVVLTHYHGDHTTGTAGYLLAGARPEVIATATTRRLIAEQEAGLPADRETARPVLLPDRVIPDAGDPIPLELGDRTVLLHRLLGHTASDIALQVDDVVFAGDLVWNGFFPNYMDAVPSALHASVSTLRELTAGTYVSGHGALAGPGDLERYIDLLADVEAAAREAWAAGRDMDAAAAEYETPAALGEWYRFSPRYPAVAFAAWARELG